MGDTLKRDHKGRPLFLEFPRRAEIMERASNDLWEALKHVTVKQLKALQPTGEFVPIVDALITVRQLMGEDTATVLTIEKIERSAARVK